MQHYAQKYIKPELLKKYGKCQLNLNECLVTNNLQVHHKKYTKKISDCMLVCLNCHKKMHRINQNLSLI